MPAPQGPVTLLSKLAGIIILLVGLVLTAVGAGLVWSYRDGVSGVAGTRSLLAVIGVGILVIGVPILLGGIGVLRGAVWGRIIGIVSSLLFGAWSLFGAVSMGNVLLVLLSGLAFVLCAYSAIVLMFRWRRSATA